MAIDELELKIQASSNDAIKSLDNIDDRLEKLEKSLKSIDTMRLQDLSKSLRSINKLMSTDKGVSAFQDSIHNITSGLKELTDFISNINTTNLDKVVSLVNDVSKISNKQLEQAAKSARKLNNALADSTSSKSMGKKVEDIEAFKQSIQGIGSDRKFFGSKSSLEREIDKVSNKLEDLYLKNQKYDLKPNEVGRKGWQSLQIDIEATSNYLKNLQNQLNEMSATPKLQNFWETPEFQSKLDGSAQADVEVETNADYKKRVADIMANIEVPNISASFDKEFKQVQQSAKQTVDSISESAKNMFVPTKLGQGQAFTKEYTTLATQIDKAERSLEKLYTRQELFDNTNVKKSSQKYQMLTTSIDKAERELEGLNNQMKQLQASGGDVEIVSPFQNMSDAAGNASEIMRVLSNSLRTIGAGKLATSIGQASTTVNSLASGLGSASAAAGGTSAALAGIGTAIPIIGIVVASIGAIVTVATKAGKAVFNAFKRIGNTVKNVALRVKELVTNILTIGTASNKSRTAIGKLLNRVLQTLKSGLISRSVTSVVKDVGTSIEELAQYSSRIKTPFSENIKLLVADFKWLARTIATTLEPVINAITPLIDFLITKLVSALNVINQFFNALMGNGTYTKANKQMEDYANSVSAGAKAQQKLNKQLLGFNEVTNITTNDSSGGGGGGASSSGGDAYETEPIDPSIQSFLGRLKESWQKADFTWLGALIAGKLSDALDSIDWNTIKGTAEKVGKSLATLINGFITFPDMGTKIGNAIGEAINTFISGIDGFIGNLNWDSVGTFIGDMINGALDSLEWNKVLNIANNLGKGLADAINNLAKTEALSNSAKAIGKFISSAVSSAWSFVTGLDFKQLGTEISNGINKAINEMATKDATGKTGWEKLAETLSTGIKGVFNTLSTALDGLDWGTIGTSVIQFITSIDWTGLFASATNLKTKLSDALWNLFTLAVGAMQATVIDVTLNVAQSAQDFYNKKIKPIFDEVKKKTLELKANLTGISKEKIDKIKTAWNNFKKAVKSKLTLKASFTDYISSKLKKIQDYWNKLKANVTLKLTAIFNDSFTSKLKSVWNAIADKINSAIETINKIPGVNITARLPKLYAEGGFPQQGELFIAREKGPEMVGRMGNQNVVANNGQIAQGIAMAVASANREGNALLRQQNELLMGILQKETGISYKEVGKAAKRYSQEEFQRTGRMQFA